MLLNARVHADKAALIPAVVHADGTARVQTIRREEQPELHALLLEVGRLDRRPVLVNTSLNLAGEPIRRVAGRCRQPVRALAARCAGGSGTAAKAPLAQMLSRRNPGPTRWHAPPSRLAVSRLA